MKIGIIGRTRTLLEAAKRIIENGFEIPFVYTCRSESYYQCGEDDFRCFANDINADFFSDLEINSDERVGFIKRYNCDVAISMNWLSILRDPICKSFKCGIWNAHVGDLPRYRGNACPNWAILNNEPRIGLSIHKMVPGELDSGDIIAKVFYELSNHTYISDIYNWMDAVIPELFLNSLQKLKDKTLTLVPQSQEESDILRCYPRKPQDSRLFWDHSENDLYKMIRASSRPFSGAFCYLEDGTKIRIWKANQLQHYGKFCAIPGQVLYAMGEDPVIACSDGILQITDVTLDGDNCDAKKLILKSLRNRLV